MCTLSLGFHWLLWMMREPSKRGDGREAWCSARLSWGEEEGSPHLETAGGPRRPPPCLFSPDAPFVSQTRMPMTLSPESALLLETPCVHALLPTLCTVPTAHLGALVTLRPLLPAGWSVVLLGHAEVTALLLLLPAPEG